MKMTNAEIYSLSNALNVAFNDEERYFPAKLNFFIQKNKNVLAQLKEEIESVRLNIILQYGNINESEGTYSVEPDKIKIVNQELADLLNISIEVPICTLKISEFDGLEFTPKQMQALLFMIEED